MTTTDTAWSDGYLEEDAALALARQRATEVGVVAVTPTVGATLRLLAATVGARAVVEVGTGTGVSTLWLLRGMTDGGILTSIDSEAEHQSMARTALAEAGLPTSRTRLIAGAAGQVLPRLSDGGYDLVLADAGPREHGEQLTDLVRLLRPGGLLIVHGALGGGTVADISARDPDTVALRELAGRVREHPELLPAMLPIGRGLLAAVKVLVRE